MKISNHPESNFDPSGSLAPSIWYGPGAPSTERAFTGARLCSLYIDVTNNALYVKTANTGAAADWKPLVTTGTTITGDVTISGTLTAGDLVSTNA